jgi:pimeloyl-ACP methyl ester carboxylesterase
VVQELRLVDGVDVHVEGTGPTVVMVHGWPDTWRLWDSTVAALSPRWRCVRFSLPGYDLARPPRRMTLDGLVDFLAAVVDEVSPGEPVTLLLHDWGAVFGYEYAARHPQRVSRIAGVDIGDVNTSDYLRSLSAKAKLMIAGYQLQLALAWKIGGATGTRMSRAMARALRCPTDAASIGWQMNYPYALQWSGGLRGLARFRPHCPLLYLYGRRKPFQFHSPRWLERVAALPGGAVAEFDTSHWVMVDDPKGFNRRVRQWLESTASALPSR